MRWALVLGALGLMTAACDSRQAATSTTADVSTSVVSESDASEPPPTTAPASPPSIPQGSQTTPVVDTAAPSTTMADIAPSTTPAGLDPSGVPLAQILEPYEARALANTMFTSYRFSCWPYADQRGVTWPNWELAELDREDIVGRGSVLSCLPRTDPPADVGNMDLIVLDDHGTVTSWWAGSDAVAHVPEAPGGLLCREYMAEATFIEAMEWMGASPPWNDDLLAYQWVLAYWFLDGQPVRMDADDNGIPCELLFDATVVNHVWTGDQL